MADGRICAWHSVDLVDTDLGWTCPTCRTLSERSIAVCREMDTCEDPLNVRLRRWAMVPGTDGPHVLVDAAALLEARQVEIDRLRAALAAVREEAHVSAADTFICSDRFLPLLDGIWVIADEALMPDGPP